MNHFAHPLPTPSPVYYTTAAPAYSVYGWNVALDRRVEEFSTLSNATTAGFALAGSGSATVSTPPRYRRRARYRVTVSSRSGTTAVTDRIGASRRLTIQVPLGPSNTAQEYTAGATLSGTKVYTTHVTLARLAR
jgi:hypothetical protein